MRLLDSEEYRVRLRVRAASDAFAERLERRLERIRALVSEIQAAA
jgi:hypothetical protein